ncbi:hypothetical protein SAICODRAFT_176662 [Saitoella complicata NRRL Y-17804]|uniref:uncharacterized protein n=1 Tax=Saitoella complicata (strain BCRC 22490 / CBS 7301 / JCM 7358 / NBRC 10748 / NRRL Y-17804) TaxID=698492 RepID=UPI000867DD7F|nr:uncharacterized protein SAICODRAFT_176662 [Saitoella complicata NRRL Y-17804]ODQ50098.1 hypothetical protein SAICODRAFT_176662 [Saitoella complicata NRRL Y-17804]
MGCWVCRYFFNVAVDTTIGVPILYVILTALTSFTVYLGIHGTISGQYSPPSTTSTTTKRKSRWSWWFKQTALYALSLLLMKVLIFVVFATLPGLVEALEELGEVLLRWTRGYPRVEEGFVLFVFPLVMNVLQAWLSEYSILPFFLVILLFRGRGYAYGGAEMRG